MLTLYGLKPEDWGYRQKAIAEISRATGLSPNSIKGWGKNFDTDSTYVLKLLDYADMANELALFVNKYNNLLPKIDVIDTIDAVDNNPEHEE
ncbi:MAG: hypothetical protein F6K22_02100 [Okeania sp. SIO2F4]|uniref:hypothetical protein n=1 Tax=Okeania sp. SIO2F4 TaxID=2607790 RepID=UPI00142A170E|nr:hypothetical protein [Okeania sp. SIO2F4]NES01718.1 hypothetical protein [Okeania sp. SIO2F4]